MEHSIKAKVIALAQSDPYLTVKDLAREAGTTTRYVRTILSEADLSLHEMRRLYARRLERDGRRSTGPREILDVQTELTIKKVAGSQLSPSVACWTDLELFLASRLHKRNALLCYDQLITPRELLFGADDDGDCLRKLLPRNCQEQLEIRSQEAQILPAPQELGQALGLSKGEQVLRLTTFLTTQEEPVALEIRWLGLHGLVLKWSKFEGELEVGLGS
ncbi:MAG TPA: UTRA domain-containing protein [Limnochordia bacterium]|jgi:hypothetical protein|nr:UTRA domain-containing protein [Limnochordia bacterium]